MGCWVAWEHSVGCVVEQWLIVYRGTEYGTEGGDAKTWKRGKEELFEGGGRENRGMGPSLPHHEAYVPTIPFPKRQKGEGATR